MNNNITVQSNVLKYLINTIFEQFLVKMISKSNNKNNKNIKESLNAKSISINLLIIYSPQRKYMGGVLGIGGTSFLCFDVWTYGMSK